MVSGIDKFRLMQLLPGDANIDVPEPIRDDLRRFVQIIEDDQTLDPKSFNVRMTRAEGITALRVAYGLE